MTEPGEANVLPGERKSEGLMPLPKVMSDSAGDVIGEYFLVGVGDSPNPPNELLLRAAPSLH